MEKLCKNCSYFDYKEHICTKLESGFNYDKDKTKDILDWESYEGLTSVTEDDEFYCKYWR